MPPFDFAATTSLVTGASSGLGAEFARQLAARGSGLVLVARSADRLEALAEDLRTRHRVTVTALPADLGLADEVGRVAAHAAATEVDVLVNNAGFGTYGTFASLDAGREHAEIMVNAVAAVDLAHAVLPAMLARRRGVRILALCPGPVATGFVASLGDQAATTSTIYRRTADPADIVRAGLRGFDRDAMTVIPGLRTRLLAQGHRFLPRTVMVRMTGKMLAASPGARNDRPKPAATPPAPDART